MSDLDIQATKDIVNLTAIEARVLGALMEKQLTTPDAYPLTLNALVTACNQKTSREPVSNYSNGDIEHCVNQLRQRQFVEVEYGSRANRYDQRLTRKLFLEKPAQAVLTIMLLRGPQTINELLTRTERMANFSSGAAIEDLLNLMCQKTAPIIMKISRQAGQREDRYMHLLCGEPDLSQWSAPTTSSSPSQRQDLEQRVVQLEAKLQKVLEHLNLDVD